MNGNSQQDPCTSSGDGALASGVDRRKLIRAGLASTPVLLGLKSESALATGSAICKPSMWASLKATPNCQLSRQVTAKKGVCKHFSYWASQDDDECNRRFHDSSYKTKSGTRIAGAYFSKTFFTSDKALKDVCKTNWSVSGKDRDDLARHCAAVYLSIKKGYDCPITVATCQEMWASCKSGGMWTEPRTKVKWTAADCNEYLSYVCGIDVC